MMFSSDSSIAGGGYQQMSFGGKTWKEKQEKEKKNLQKMEEWGKIKWKFKVKGQNMQKGYK
jgi:hypothetical protein